MNQTMPMRTLTGWFYPLQPSRLPVRIRDIARGLATRYRYASMTREMYSVAEHSVIVSCYVKPEYARQALLHDASEAYLGDMILPLKSAPEMRWFKELEDNLQAHIDATFGIEPTSVSNAAVKEIDQRVRVHEMPLLLAPGTELENAERDHEEHMMRVFARDGAPLVPAPVIPCLSWKQAEHVFLRRFEELFPEVTL